MSRKEVIDKVTDDGVRLVAKLRHHAADKCAAARMPFQIDRAMKIARAMDFRPPVRTPGLFGPGFDKAKLLLQLRIPRDLTAQRPAPGCDHLNHRLHSVVRFNLVATFAIFL